MLMSVTTAQAAVMEQTAARFEQVHDSLAGMLTRLMADLELLRTHWQGAGGQSFAQAKEAWADDQKALQRALAQTVDAIRATGKRYAATDAEAADRLARTGRGVELPL